MPTWTGTPGSSDLDLQGGALAYGTEGTNAALTAGGRMTTPNQPAFSANNSTSDTNATGDATQVTVDFDNEIYDIGSNFAADTFTAPVAGKYEFSVGVAITNLSSSHTSLLIDLVTSNREYRLAQVNPYAMQDAASAAYIYATSVIGVDMDAADTAYVRIIVSGGTKTVTIFGDGSMKTYFTGRLAQ